MLRGHGQAPGIRDQAPGGRAPAGRAPGKTGGVRLVPCAGVGGTSHLNPTRRRAAREGWAESFRVCGVIVVTAACIGVGSSMIAAGAAAGAGQHSSRAAEQQSGNETTRGGLGGEGAGDRVPSPAQNTPHEEPGERGGDAALPGAFEMGGGDGDSARHRLEAGGTGGGTLNLRMKMLAPYAFTPRRVT